MDQNHTISLHVSYEQEFMPDLMVFEITLQEKGKELKFIKKKNNDHYLDLLQRLSSFGINKKDIIIKDFQSNFVKAKNMKISDEYSTRLELELKLQFKISCFYKIVHLLKSLKNIQFKVEFDLLNKDDATNHLLEQLSKKAFIEAEILVKHAGGKLGKINSIQYDMPHQYLFNKISEFSDFDDILEEDTLVGDLEEIAVSVKPLLLRCEATYVWNLNSYE